MALDNAWNMYIFRDGRTTVRGTKLTSELIEKLLSLKVADSPESRTELLDALLRAGELECALADADSVHSNIAASVTDDLAAALVCRCRHSCLHTIHGSELAKRVSAIEPPELVSVTPPEGFAYYALNPLDYVGLLKRVPIHNRFAGVIGIRSVGTTISAVVQAALRGEGVCVERITVRPTGHPYDRKVAFTERESHWLATLRSRQAEFWVADEGPGMSGSSFLSVGDALVSSGVRRADIAFLCSREANPDSLTAPRAATRWTSFRSYHTWPTRHLPKEADRYIAGGIWRADAFASEEQWPASWLQMERLKFLSRDRSTLFKFEGIGRFGAAVFDRATRIHDAGFGPQPLGQEEGFGVYKMIRGRTLSCRDVDSSVLQRIAEYCAFRSSAMQFPVLAVPELQTMLRHNVQEEFGADLPDEAVELRIEKPVIADGRMLPHKWIDADGVLLKVDGAAHGDDHFFPGPTDIAWDLAGTIIEWNLNYRHAQYFLDCYSKRSRDDVAARLSTYLLAYSVFRMAYCRMAAAASQGTPEEPRLLQDYLRYRAHAQHYLERVRKCCIKTAPTLHPPQQVKRGVIGTNA